MDAPPDLQITAGSVSPEIQEWLLLYTKLIILSDGDHLAQLRKMLTSLLGNHADLCPATGRLSQARSSTLSVSVN